MNSFSNKRIDMKKYEFSVLLDSVTPISEEDFNRQIPNLAKKYPFELDVFQKQAILQIEKGENVFVAAHTSAGKTVVAEYAIAKAFSRNTRVIYTSPIKALSNQKFRDLKQEFKEVGIITGDIQLNPEAPCLIMTTEILLQMLYANAEEINDLEFVIFDECHYVNDSKRGHVWEEVFILLPGFVKLVLLSATVPNVIEFSDWLGRTRHKKTYVVSTTKRPVPLKHYFYLGRDGKSQNQQILILEGEGQLIKSNFDEAFEIVKERKNKFGYIRVTAQSERNVYLNLIRHLQKTDKLPVICFTLSRKKCDSNLQVLLSIKEENLFLTSKSESYHIRRFVRKHLKHLKDSDLKLEQVMRVSAMLERGFGVHHSGVLPILKELTEILFSSGLVKVLFATETFAMGVNMPARTVVFDSLNKHDGTCRRNLKPSEYIQMAGRAGRRGKDADGTVIILCKYDIPSIVECNQVMKGAASYLESQFRLTYHMILNMLKSKASSIENFLSSSYREHSKVLLSSNVDTKINDLCNRMEQLPQLICDLCSTDIDSWYHSFMDFLHFKTPNLMSTILIRASDKKLLNPGRLVVFNEQDTKHLFNIGILLKVVKGVSSSIGSILVLARANDDLNYTMKEINVENVCCVLNKQVKGVDISGVLSENQTNSFSRIQRKDCTKDAGRILEAQNQPDNIELLKSIVNNFVSHDKLGKLDPDTRFLIEEYGKRLKELAHPNVQCINCKQFIEHYELYQKRCKLEEDLSQINYKLSTESLELLPEYNSRIKVLQRLNFLDEHLVLLPKGHIASCISDNELLITEIVFENLLGNLSDEAIPAILSCFIFDNKGFKEPSTENVSDIPELVEITNKIIDIGLHFGEIEKEEQVEECSTHFIDVLNMDSIRAVYEWAKGESFLEIMNHTELQEGIMVRCIQRVDELLKNIRLAAKNLESKEFETKLERASRLIRRDIVFAPSLYTVQEVVNVYDDEANTTKPSEPQIVPMDASVSSELETVTPDNGESDQSDDELFNYNFVSNEIDSETFNEEEQFNANFI